MERPDLLAVWDFYGGHLHDRQGEQSTRCLVHEDRHPSCSVNLTTGLWSCHACGKGGTAYTLIELKEGTAGGFAAVVAKAEEITGRSLRELPPSATGGRTGAGLFGKAWAPRYRKRGSAWGGSLTKLSS